MKNKIKDILEKHQVIHENGTYWDEKLLNENIEKMYEDLFDLYNVNQQRELLKAFRLWYNNENEGGFTTITNMDIDKYLKSL